LRKLLEVSHETGTPPYNLISAPFSDSSDMTLINNRVDAGYYGNLQSQVLSLVKFPCFRALEIGCGNGQGLVYLKNRGVSYVAGVELVPEVARLAADRPEVDKIFTGNVEAVISDLESEPKFDLIMASHVLEHLIDPWSTLRSLKALLAPTGQLVGAIPNVRHVRTVLPLLLTGRWQYQDYGILDWTHLRFFTRSAIVDLLQSTGFKVDKLVAEFQRNGRAANMITFGAFRDLLALAYNFSAVPVQQCAQRASEFADASLAS
jgi:2-polyprenyl-3-methyl-5-hydroxy-6-metoxy-1,4-benzoquinol methylase